MTVRENHNSRQTDDIMRLILGVRSTCSLRGMGGFIVKGMWIGIVDVTGIGNDFEYCNNCYCCCCSFGDFLCWDNVYP